MSRLFYILLTLASIAFPLAPDGAHSQAKSLKVVREIRVSGNLNIGTSKLVEGSGLRIGHPLSTGTQSRLIQSILVAYRSEGYWNVKVSAPLLEEGRDGLRVRISLEEGIPVSVADVSVREPLPVPAAQLTSILETRRGDRLIPSRLHDDAEALLDFLGRRGYPFAEVDPGVVMAPGQQDVEVVWIVDAGPRISIDGVRFSGNLQTREDLLARETGLTVGDLFDQRSVDDATRALRRLPWLVGVSDPEVEKDARSGRYVIHYEVEEARATSLEGGIGLLPGVDGAYEWVGRLHFASQNLAGTGRRANFLWERPNPFCSDLNLAYGEPWLFGYPLNGGIEIAFQQRSGFVDVGVGLQLTYQVGRETEVGLSVARSSIRPDSVSAISLDRQFVWSVGGRFQWDRRGNDRRPSRGWLAASSFDWDRVTKQDALKSSNRVRYLSEAALFAPLRDRAVLGVGLHGQGVLQDGTVTADALLRLGGARTIRGYLEEHFLAEHAIWANVSVSQHLGRRASAYVFTDVGLLRIPSGEANWASAMGYGVGLQILTRRGLMTVEYGLSKEDSPGQGKIHVRMVSEF